MLKLLAGACLTLLPLAAVAAQPADLASSIVNDATVSFQSRVSAGAIPSSSTFRIAMTSAATGFSR